MPKFTINFQMSEHTADLPYSAEELLARISPYDFFRESMKLGNAVVITITEEGGEPKYFTWSPTVRLM